MSVTSPIRIAVDAMGGDLGPHLCVAAAQKFKSLHPDVELVLVGNEAELRSFVPPNDHSQFEFVDAPDVVEMGEKVSSALRHKQKSSMWIALELLRHKQVSACVSGGNTGALMAVGRHLLGTLEGIERPAICKLMPTGKGFSYLLDLGANVDCSADQLCEFALLGAAISRTMGEDKPRVALLNLALESDKGPESVRLAAQIMANDTRYQFAGFIEGDQIYVGDIDVIVCDGFTGNVALKVSEGVVRYLSASLKTWFERNIRLKMLGLVVKPTLLRWWSQFDPDRFNGAVLLGLNGIVVKSHGSASQRGFESALGVALNQVSAGQTQKIASMLSA